MGPYLLPAAAGIALGRNETRWSPSIKPEDGLIRLVPGLGSRAMERQSDDYSILASPGRPDVPVNVNPREVQKYAPKRVDALNLATNTVDTVWIDRLLSQFGGNFPAFTEVFSVIEQGEIRSAGPEDLDPKKLAADFRGLIQNTPFMGRVKKTLDCLEEALGGPVDLELAYDGKELYLVQCGPYRQPPTEAPTPIPQDIPQKDLVFSASKHVANGWMPDITHIVYVQPRKYAALSSDSERKEVGKVIKRLNRLLPKRKFILIGPRKVIDIANKRVLNRL